ncbi:MAG: DUF814 domain-containing protein [Cytophagales bacterium]|nr:MAG: DUF814 domain-containing protein [Cytophagales bacterium]TAF60296.1 MAG: DUF814 domain-containing protein [Cytophagales bacterium]
MHNTYFFIAKLSAALVPKLKGKVLATAFSQNKDELMLGFTDSSEDFWIRATLQSDLCCLSFPSSHDRARRNSVNLFEAVEGQEVLEVRQFLNERCFGLIFKNGLCLLFKLYGRSANILLFENDVVIGLFKQKLEQDRQLRWSALDRPLDQTHCAFMSTGLRPTFPTLSQTMREVMKLDTLTAPAQWEQIQAFLTAWTEPSCNFYLIKPPEAAPFISFFDDAKHQLLMTSDPVEMLNHYYKAFTRVFFLEHEKQQAIKELQKKQKQTENYLKKSQERLSFLQNSARYDEIGHIIMANLHQIPKRTKEIELFDFYRNNALLIALKEELSPQKNAENYYRKAKNQKIELQNLQEVIQKREQQWLAQAEQIERVKSFMQSRELRVFLKQIGILKEQATQAASTSFPFKHLEHEGFTILIGKNSQNNDLLTQKYAYKEDLWLHARDVSGSHVVVRYRSGQSFPDSVVRRAAELAAYYSKRKTDSLCPVMVTPKKFVRKPKGAPAGAVTVEKESTILVEPRGLEG